MTLDQATIDAISAAVVRQMRQAEAVQDVTEFAAMDDEKLYELSKKNKQLLRQRKQVK